MLIHVKAAAAERQQTHVRIIRLQLPAKGGKIRPDDFRHSRGQEEKDAGFVPLCDIRYRAVEPTYAAKGNIGFIDVGGVEFTGI